MKKYDRKKKGLTKINGILTSDNCKDLLSYPRMRCFSMFSNEANDFFVIFKLRIVFSNSIHAISTRARAA